MQIEIQEAAKQGARLIELRLDFLAKAPDFKRLLANRPCPMVATVRRPVDGGRWAHSEDERQMLLRQAIVSGFDWVDIETDIADKLRRFKDVKRIVSYHNLQGIPDDLEKIFETMCKQDPDVVKIAVTAQTPADNLRVLKLLHLPPVPTIAFCMGDMGVPSRLIAAKFGAPFTYAAFNKERGIAPGIPSFDDLKNTYQYERINADTEVFGVLGDPIAHSLSPLIHNTAFKAMNINAMYVPFRVPRSTWTSFLQAFDQLPVRGYSVTIPHKETAAKAGQAGEPAVVLTQAANTLIRHPEGGFVAYNTDYQAALDSLIYNMPATADGQPGQLQSRAVLLLGAGGVARAIAHALHRSGCVLTISNRTSEKGLKLAEEIGCRHVDWGGRHSVLCEMVINCTSIGMYPNMDESPLHHSFLKPGMIVFDSVYTPETTLLIKEARARGCHVITGVDMFVRQAALQFKLFTGQEPPLDLMRKVVRRAFSPVTIKEEE